MKRITRILALLLVVISLFVSCGNTDISQYTIVTEKGGAYEGRAAIFLKNYILSETGFELEIKEASDKCPTPHAIRLCTTASNGYVITADKKDIVITASESCIVNATRICFENMFADGNTQVLLPGEGEEIKGNGLFENGFVVKATGPENQIRPGVVWYKIRYTDYTNLPVVAYVLEVEKGAADIITGTPDNGYVKGNKTMATTLQEMNSAKEAGYDVLAAVNADFFNIDGDYSPRGLCIKDGVVITLPEDEWRTYFGITYDGEYVIGTGTPGSNDLSKIRDAVGGSVVLLDDGEFVTNSDNARHPRTVVGINTETGTLYLVVVDGRQTKISNGASYGDLSILMKSIGATDSINLDGGGSSNFIVQSGTNFITVNSPSDGALRNIYDSVIVVAR